MAGFGDELTARLEKIQQVTSDQATRRVTNAAGAAGKKAALEAAADSLGGDRKFSHWPRGGALNAGYDGVAGASQVVINFRGPWRLAESGRRSTGPIYRRGLTATTGASRKGNARAFRAIVSFAGGQGHGAIRTPEGPRARSSYKPSRGLKTYSKATRKASVDVPKAAHEQFLQEVASVMR